MMLKQTLICLGTPFPQPKKPSVINVRLPFGKDFCPSHAGISEKYHGKSKGVGVLCHRIGSAQMDQGWHEGSSWKDCGFTLAIFQKIGEIRRRIKTERPAWDECISPGLLIATVRPATCQGGASSSRTIKSFQLAIRFQNGAPWLTTNVWSLKVTVFGTLHAGEVNAILQGAERGSKRLQPMWPIFRVWTAPNC